MKLLPVHKKSDTQPDPRVANLLARSQRFGIRQHKIDWKSYYHIYIYTSYVVTFYSIIIYRDIHIKSCAQDCVMCRPSGLEVQEYSIIISAAVVKRCPVPAGKFQWRNTTPGTTNRQMIPNDDTLYMIVYHAVPQPWSSTKDIVKLIFAPLQPRISLCTWLTFSMRCGPVVFLVATSQAWQLGCWQCPGVWRHLGLFFGELAILLGKGW